MPQVQVNIGGRAYRLACNPGEEPHLESLAKYLDGKIEEMQGAFRDIADQRIVVMAALTVVDELFEARRKAEARAAEAAESLAQETSARTAAEARAADIADSLARETSARAAAETRAALLEAAIDETSSRADALTEALNNARED